MAENERLKKVLNWLIGHEIVSSQEDMAGKLGVSVGHLSHLMTNRRMINEKFVRNLCFAFPMINPGYLLREENNLSSGANVPNQAGMSGVEAGQSDLVIKLLKERINELQDALAVANMRLGESEYKLKQKTEPEKNDPEEALK